ncbi:2-phospho-L-lactate transferase CofD family protein, partial [bacterium]|nr:2-phospho-L-lactate transferase CofD family protein [bacterium]
MLNTHGEVLLERRSQHKDLFPGLYDIPGGHVKPGSSPAEAAVEELREELSLEIDPERLSQLSDEDGLIERVVMPERGILNLERKTAYLLELTDEERDAILRRAQIWSRLSSADLGRRGIYGEVSHVEFWSWERLLASLRIEGERVVASGTHSALAEREVVRAVNDRCEAALRERREAFASANRPALGSLDWTDASDDWLYERFLDAPKERARGSDVELVFENGADQIAGAYQIGPFRLHVSGDEYWDRKLADPESRYVENLISAIARGQDEPLRTRLLEAIPAASVFVGELLNLPLQNGNRFRDGLGNLAEIAAGRRATIAWLERKFSDLLPSEFFQCPTRYVTGACIEGGRALLERSLPRLPNSGYERFRALVLLGLGASMADFNNPAFQRHLAAGDEPEESMTRVFGASVSDGLCSALGGEHFLKEFFDEYVSSLERCTLVYFAGNAAQAYISMAISQELLAANRNLRVLFIPKSGSPGNDLSFEDARSILFDGASQLLADLGGYEEEGRFNVIEHGPLCHGVDPRRLSLDVSRALQKATVILAEGQAYAEIRGWKKPAYIAFRANGRVAEAIHGVARSLGACGFVRLTPGIDHFQDFHSVVHRRLTDRDTGERIPAASQTTREYVDAILSENFSLLVRFVFRGDREQAIRQLRLEAHRTGKVFPEVLTGVASSRPDPSVVSEQYSGMRFPVFACGGGGGFNSVTLKALRMLGVPTFAGVPSTDDGGSSGDLQRWFKGVRGFVFGVGDLASILEDAARERGKQALLAYRFDREPELLTDAVMERVAEEMCDPTFADSPIGECEDFLSFVVDQLNLARIIDERFRNTGTSSDLSVKGSSIRNLNVIAAYELCGLLGDEADLSVPSQLSAMYVLEKALGLEPGLMVAPVTLEESVLFLEYGEPVRNEAAAELGPAFAVEVEGALTQDRHRLYGQRLIDKLPQPGGRRTVGVVRSVYDSEAKPTANPEYLARLRQADLFVMGAGSLIGSQLSQLVVPGVVETLVQRREMRKILVVNHVKMDETRGMSLRDHIRLIETAATESVTDEFLREVAPETGHLRISDLFTDVVVPRTVAREVEAEMDARGWSFSEEPTEHGEYVELMSEVSKNRVRVYRNRYVDFLQRHPDVRERYEISAREIEVLSFLEQPGTLYRRRSEAGRYRGALFAVGEDIEYLVRQGIQRRNIHEVDSVGEN